MNIRKRYGILVLRPGSVMPMLLGWFLPIISMDIYADVPIIGKYYFLQETRSVMGALQKLFENGNWVPAILILLFGIMVPFVKTAFIIVFLFSTTALEKWAATVSTISKSAMPNDFSMGILIAFLAANVLGQIQANFHVGFYCFTAYCILSNLVAQQVMRKKSGYTSGA